MVTQRSVRVADEVWLPARVKALQESLSISEVTQRLLVIWLEGKVTVPRKSAGVVAEPTVPAESPGWVTEGNPFVGPPGVYEGGLTETMLRGGPAEKKENPVVGAVGPDDPRKAKLVEKEEESRQRALDRLLEDPRIARVADVQPDPKPGKKK